MKRRRDSGQPSKRRTTLTLPEDALAQAEDIARRRRVNLSTVISEVLSDGLRLHTAAERSQQVLEGYRHAFHGFSEDELALLDGIILEPEKVR